jgi:hypothetical protein
MEDEGEAILTYCSRILLEGLAKKNRTFLVRLAGLLAEVRTRGPRRRNSHYTCHSLRTVVKIKQAARKGLKKLAIIRILFRNTKYEVKYATIFMYILAIHFEDTC